MSKVPDLVKRLLVGRALRSTALHHQLLPKRVALPVFASDALSSVAYAPQEILVILSIGGVGLYSVSPWVAAGVVLVMLTVVASYRQNVHAYPSGGGDYEVATTNLGPTAGLTVASALLVDYVLTVAVSVANGADYVGATIPFVAEHRPLVAVAIVALLTVMNLRGIRESGVAFAVPTYAFMIAVVGMVAWGLFRLVVLGDELRAPTADYRILGEQADLAGFAMAFLVLRAFSSGCAALTGVEAISNGVPAFRKPKSKNAATTLLMMGLIAVTMFSGIIFLGLKSGVKLTDPATVASNVIISGHPAGPGYYQQPIIAQVASAVFGHGSFLFVVIAAVTALILFLAANTAFNGFPVLGSILAQDRYLPRQLHTRGDRLAFSNGIVILAAGACLLIWAFDADVSKLLNLYIVGVFVSFTLSQIGMVRHWTRHLRTETDAKARFHMMRSRVINGFGAVMTGLVLVVVLATKFTHGAYIVCIAMPVLFLMMKGIRRHYDRVAEELAAPEGHEADESLLPARNHAIVLVSKIHKPTLRALAYARATRPSSLEAVTVSVDSDEANRLREEWDRRGIGVPLKILDSPYREITGPVLEYVKSLRRRSPRDVVTVYIPEYVVGRWWEHLLHNQSALRLKGRLLFKPGVMVTSVPFQLASSDRLKGRREPSAPGASRRSYQPPSKNTQVKA
ncbi:amino acid/polyamine/organocation transporter, APC superfamily [Microbispora rosea]|uniref:Amino acid/polyamine/organocation transporter, APC superfamily n=1 Tax=Microbispora rosea TaxID=58117 RepID=A0A1N6ZDL4_9ACTN|nr:APC family permease [Microbispora rosea]GIH47629.1 DNA-binding protein [Microbispora rosea subsp. rosea]SIR25002.1 amino acid/polyamine/organocation transporter, APC superfamily [Microbispora rosea]